MKVFPVIIFALVVHLPSIFCASAKCSKSKYGKYDQTERRDEKIHVGLLELLRNEHRRANASSKQIGTKECPQLYQRYSKDHTYCKTSTCDMISNGVTEEDKKIILDVHNSLRSKLATGEEKRYKPLPSVANMVEIEWDDELARVAQAHSDLCKFGHDSEDQKAVENFSVGQNLQWSSTDEKHWKGVESWYKEEVCFFRKEYSNPFKSGDDYGHFTQVTWATTWKIGCGFTAYRENGNKNSLYTCNYGPGGNLKGGQQYIEGKPCSQCPPNTECSKNYPGLCKSKTQDGPQRARPSSDQFILFCDFKEGDQQECKNVKVTGSRSFETRHIYSGDYKTVVLQGGESITIDLGKAQNVGGFCPFVYARFGPNNAKDALGSVVEISFFFSRSTKPASSTKILPPKGSSFFTAGTHMMFDGELQATIKLTAEVGASPQYFDIAFWGISKGACKTTF